MVLSNVDWCGNFIEKLRGMSSHCYVYVPLWFAEQFLGSATSPCSGPCEPEAACPARTRPFWTHFTTTLAEQNRGEISITVTVRERKGEKELEKGGTERGGCDGRGVKSVCVGGGEETTHTLSKGWRLGRRGRQTQVEHAAHIIALACVSHRYTAAGRGPVPCYQVV